MDAPRALWTESFTRTSLAAVTQGARAANDRDLGKRWLSVLEASVSCPTVVNGSQQTERLVLRFVVAADNGGTEVGRTSEFPDALSRGRRTPFLSFASSSSSHQLAGGRGRARCRLSGALYGDTAFQVLEGASCPTAFGTLASFLLFALWTCAARRSPRNGSVALGNAGTVFSASGSSGKRSLGECIALFFFFFPIAAALPWAKLGWLRGRGSRTKCQSWITIRRLLECNAARRSCLDSLAVRAEKRASAVVWSPFVT